MIFRNSSISDAHECLQKYYRKHIAKDVKDDSSVAMDFGTALHLGIKTHYESGSAIDVFRLYWYTMGYRGTDEWQELLDLGDKFLIRFVDKYAVKFAPLHFEKQLCAPMENSQYQGTLDMLCVYENKITLVDWKTSARPYTIKALERKEQLYGYAALVEELLGIKVEQIMYFIFVKSTETIQTNIKMLLTREKLDSMVGNIKMMVRDLEKRVEFPRNPNCKYCVCDNGGIK